MQGTPTSPAEYRAIAAQTGTNASTAYNPANNTGTDRVNGVSQVAGIPNSSIASPNSTNQPPTGVPATGGATTTTPVVTSAAAKADAQQKYDTWQSLQAQVAQQQSVLAQKAAQDAADNAKADSDAAQLKIKQQDSNTAATAANAKANAVALANAGTTNTTNTTGAEGTTTTTNTTTPNTPQSAGDTANAGINNATSNFLSRSQDISEAKTSLAQQQSQALASLLAGTIPLSAPQSALISSLQNQLVQNEQQQTVANNAYTGAVTENAMRNGGEYTPTQTAGTIQNAISVGVSKIQALDNSAASTIAKMESDFQTQDFDIINKNYDVLSKQLDDKSNALKDMYDAVTTSLKDQRDYQMNVDKFNQTQDQNAFDNALKVEQQNFDEKYKQATLNLDRQKFGESVREFDANSQGGTDTGISGSVSMTANDKPDPVAQQAILDEISKTYGPMTAIQIKGLVDYTVNPTDFATMLRKGVPGMTRSTAIGLAKQLDPTYDDKQYPTRQAYIKSIASTQSGTVGGAVNSANKAINHLTSFVNSMSKIPNGISSTVNALDNAVTLNQGVRQTIGTAKTEGLGVADEMARFFKGSGTTDVGSIDAWKSQLNTNASPADVKGLTQGAITLLAGQLETLSEQYKNTMGKAPSTNFIGASALQSLSNLKNQGYQVDIPGVYYTDKNAYLSNGGSQDALNSAYTNLKNAGIPTTPENILQAAQL